MTMKDQVHMIDSETLFDWIEKDKAVIVDVREQNEYDMAHIDGATLVPLSSFNAELLPEIPSDKNLVLHCRSANRCGVAALHLLQQGYPGQIYRLTGGILAWQAGGFPVV